MKQEENSPLALRILDRREVRIFLNAVLFIINFLLIYFLWLKVFPGMTGVPRLIACWVGAYAFTWTTTLVFRGPGRLVLSLLLLGVLYVVFSYQP